MAPLKNKNRSAVALVLAAIMIHQPTVLWLCPAAQAYHDPFGPMCFTYHGPSCDVQNCVPVCLEHGFVNPDVGCGHPAPGKYNGTDQFCCCVDGVAKKA